MFESLLSGTNLPNLHPAVLHFPIVLLSLAVPLELIALWRRNQRSLQVLVAVAYVLGTLAALATWITGRQAADGAGLVDAQTQLLISDHSDLALKTLWFFTVVTLGRLAVEVFRSRIDPTVALVSRIGLLVPAGVGVWMLMETADRGGGLVYNRGVAVQGVQTPGPASKGAAEEDGRQIAEVAPGGGARQAGGSLTPLVTQDDGKVIWRPGPSERAALGAAVEVVKATPQASVRVIEDESNSGGLALESTGMVFFLLPTPQDKVLVIAELDFSSFQGRIGLVHHYQNDQAYECMAMSSDGSATLLDKSSKEDEELDQAAFDAPSEGTVRLAVSAAGSHLKGYLNGQTILHGHRPDRGVPGRVGLMMHGEGRVRILELSVSPAGGSH